MSKSDTVVTWPPNDYIAVRTRRSFDAETTISLMDLGGGAEDVERRIAMARNENYAKIVEQIKTYLAENKEE